MSKFRHLFVAVLILSSLNCFAQNSGNDEEIDLSKLENGMMGVNILGGPYYIIRRTPEETNLLIKKYGVGNLRSGNKDFILIKAKSPDSDCNVAYVAKGDQEWVNHPIYREGGFVDVCSCSWFDLSGRRRSQKCPGSDLEIAPHKFLHGDVVLIGPEVGHNNSPKPTQ
jgi:hypothetical protein